MGSFLLSNPISPQRTVATPPIIAQGPPPTVWSGPNQFSLGDIWCDSLNNIVYVLTSISGGNLIWVNTVPASGGVFSDISVSPGPSSFDGQFRVNGNINEANVIQLKENGGASGTIQILAEQGTGANSVNIASTAGGITMSTAAAEGDISIVSSGGSITIQGEENEVLNMNILSSGGTSASMNIINSTGTADTSTPADASIFLSSTAGGVGINAGKAYYITAVDSAVMEVTGAGEVLTMRSTDGNIDIEGDSSSSVNNGTVSITANANTGTDLIIDATAPAGGGNPGGGIQINAGPSGMLLSSTETTSSAIELQATGAGGGINIVSAAGGAITLSGGTTGITSSTSGVNTLTSSNTTGSDVVISATGASGGIQIAPTNTTASVAIANVTPTVSRTTTINGSVVDAAHTDLVSIADGGVSTSGSAEKHVTIATGATAVGLTLVEVATGNVSAAGNTTVNLATGNAPLGTTQAVNIGTGTAGGTKSINIGGATDFLTSVFVNGPVEINPSASTATTTIGSITDGGAVALNSATTVTALAPNVDINNSGTGATTIGSVTGGTIIAESNTASATAIQLNAHNAAGGITATVGTNNFNVSGGNIVMPTAGTGLTLTPAPATPASLLAGAGDPNGSVTAGLGSLYLNVTGSGVANRLWVNSDAGTTWVAVTTVS